MSIDAMMYFALGALVATLVMLLIMPAIWRRAVRLTKKRIEAATPITLAEFRADKDQLRAEFALSTRRLEMNVEQLRKRLSEQLSDVSRKKGDLASLKTERDEHLGEVRDLEAREAELRTRILELERESADLVQRLEQRDAALAEQAAELGSARQAVQLAFPPGSGDGDTALTGRYDEDVDELLTALAVERKRAGFLETQTRELIAHLEKSDRRSGEVNAAMAELRRNFASRDDAASGAGHDLVEAEVRIANAESRLNALLEETTEIVARGAHKHEQLLAEKLSAEAQLEQLREKVSSVEAVVLADWDTERLEQSHLRERLNDIAADVSRLVYAVDNPAQPDPEESLFDRVQRFAADGVNTEEFPVHNGTVTRPAHTPPAPSGPVRGSVADRMAALRELQGRG